MHAEDGTKLQQPRMTSRDEPLGATVCKAVMRALAIAAPAQRSPAVGGRGSEGEIKTAARHRAARLNDSSAWARLCHGRNDGDATRGRLSLTARVALWPCPETRPGNRRPDEPPLFPNRGGFRDGTAVLRPPPVKLIPERDGEGAAGPRTAVGERHTMRVARGFTQ